MITRTQGTSTQLPDRESQLTGTKPEAFRAAPRSAGPPAWSEPSRLSALLPSGRSGQLAACPSEIFLRWRVFLGELPGAELSQGLRELAVSVIGGVLTRPPDVVAKLADLAQTAKLVNQRMNAD